MPLIYVIFIFQGDEAGIIGGSVPGTPSKRLPSPPHHPTIDPVLLQQQMTLQSLKQQDTSLPAVDKVIDNSTVATAAQKTASSTSILAQVSTAADISTVAGKVNQSINVSTEVTTVVTAPIPAATVGPATDSQHTTGSAGASVAANKLPSVPQASIGRFSRFVVTSVAESELRNNRNRQVTIVSHCCSFIYDKDFVNVTIGII